MDFAVLSTLLSSRTVADVACPECGPSCRSPANRRRRVLRLWQHGDDSISYRCMRCGLSDRIPADGEAEEIDPAERAKIDRKFAEARARDQAARERRQLMARELWRQSIDSRHTWAESYLRMRGIELPAEDYLRRRTFRFHPHCPRPDLSPGPAMLVAFERISDINELHDSARKLSFLDAPVAAIHRIFGRGHRKAMLGAVGGCAVKITPDERVQSRLSICEGVETGLKLFERGTPIWALGSAGALEAFPVIAKVRELTIYADNDASGRGLDAAKRCASRWRDAGKHARIFMRPTEGSDYGET
ncbi:toprim domain-containing protein [Sinorhizobium prairiense]|uniref:toprim domain-containing protein n=1 Tax=unclassified Sinorhizobium TaxID=2613772 RepID=UPI0023D86098|nr:MULTISPECIES: toprim domain-containing protein [unclassified Sinorhizobium]WEJ11581.1 toprim domain-containing protein [Sinorhizobium sp. M103]WEJ16705.1 toprim domain-containing protein [Sinorhizobium sp. K101]WEJ38576.1 toprim domain-containing protein [Sinorhizobium sp. C101]